jgi:hypothetical protein
MPQLILLDGRQATPFDALLDLLPGLEWMGGLRLVVDETFGWGWA